MSLKPLSMEQLQEIKEHWLNIPENQKIAHEYRLSNPRKDHLPFIQDTITGECRWMNRQERRKRGFR